MNTSEFAKALAARTDMTVAEATNVTKHFLDLLKEGVNKGERIAFLGFGTFSVARRPARTGVNPRNPSQKVKIPARNVVRFTPGTSLKEAANGKFKPIAAAKKAEKKVVATAKKDVRKATSAAKKAEKKVAGTAKKAEKKVAGTAKKAVKKATPKKRK